MKISSYENTAAAILQTDSQQILADCSED